MDPFCYLYLGKQTQKTSPHYGGGIRPTWKETLKFKIDNITKLGIEIWAKALIGSDTLIGQGMIDLRKLNLANHTIQEYVDILFEGKPAGRVLLEMQFIPRQHPQQGQVIAKEKTAQNVWDDQKKPERNSWIGNIDWRGSNTSDGSAYYNSAILLENSKLAQTQDNFGQNSAIGSNHKHHDTSNLHNFKKKPGTAETGSNLFSGLNSQQQKAN